MLGEAICSAPEDLRAWKRLHNSLPRKKNSIGERTAVNEAKADLKRLIDEYERIATMLEDIEVDMKLCLPRFQWRSNSAPFGD